MDEDGTTLPCVATNIRLQSPSRLSAHAFDHRYRPDEQQQQRQQQRNRSTSASSTSSSSSVESMFERSSRSQYKKGLSSTSHSQERTPITPHTALSSPPTSARDSSTGGLLVPGPPTRKAKNRKQLSLSTTAAQQLAPQATVAQQPTPSGQVSHSVPTTPMTAVAAIPSMRRGAPPKLPQLNMAMLSLTRRPSLPVMGQGSPVGELDPGFSLVRGATPVRARRSGLTLAPLQSVRSQEEDRDRPPSTPRYGHAGGDESDASNAAVYTSGPVCVVHPHLWLFANPTAAQAKEYDVVINVAKEIASPLLEEASGHEEPTVPVIEDERRSPFPWTKPGGGTHMLESATGSMIKPRKLAGVEYVHVPWQHNASLAQDLPSLTAYMDRCLKQEKRVLVHCQQGVSRSASLVIAYVMKSMGKDVNEAYGFVKHESPWIGPNMTLIYQLCEWGKLLKREREEAQDKSHGSGGRVATDYYHRHRRSLDLSKLTSTKREGSLGRQGATSAAAATFDHSMRGMLSRRPSADPSPASAATVTGVYAHGFLSSPHEMPDSPAQHSRYPEDAAGHATLVSPRKRPRAVSSLMERTRTRSVAPEATSMSATSTATGMPTMATLRDSLTSQNGPQQAPVLKPHCGTLPSPTLRLNGVAMQNEGV